MSLLCGGFFGRIKSRERESRRGEIKSILYGENERDMYNTEVLFQTANI